MYPIPMPAIRPQRLFTEYKIGDYEANEDNGYQWDNSNVQIIRHIFDYHITIQYEPIVQNTVKYTDLRV